MISPQPDPAPRPSNKVPPAHSPPTSGAALFDAILTRPADQRQREYQYRFAQSAVFGLPVVALEMFGRSLGGPEADRWVAVLQALLATWVVYVGAAGMLFEGLLLLTRRHIAADLLPSLAALGLYLSAVVHTVQVLVTVAATPRAGSPGFHWVVLLLVVWTGLRWGWLSLSGRSPERS